MESHDYWIYYVNIDLRHHYGISVAESQTFHLAKRPSAVMSEEKRLPFAGYAPRVSWGPEHEDQEDLVLVLRPPGGSVDENGSLFATLILCAFTKQ